METAEVSGAQENSETEGTWDRVTCNRGSGDENIGAKIVTNDRGWVGGVMLLDRAGMTEMGGGVTEVSGDEEDLPFDMSFLFELGENTTPTVSNPVVFKTDCPNLFREKVKGGKERGNHMHVDEEDKEYIPEENCDYDLLNVEEECACKNVICGSTSNYHTNKVLESNAYAWRLFKCQLKSNDYYKYDNDIERWQHRSSRIVDSHIKLLLQYWKTSTSKIKHEKGKMGTITRSLVMICLRRLYNDGAITQTNKLLEALGRYYVEFEESTLVSEVR
ncbi:hypothetical protein Cgig2_025034 [Carnegiea gigantea]|uniref:Uncharacterized protein n=1 Tax=Carnegiea gigantea TaxID=171969 RepID=A0A9Q1QA50_9CARY|nr:hypothetical protein Cgig2_025034 [Carnegiea gigantea]